MDIYQKKTIWTRSITYFILLFPLLQPDYFKLIPAIDTFYLCYKAVVAIIIFPKYLFNILKNRNASKISVIVLLYCFALLFSTYINHQPLLYCFNKIIECLIFSMLIELGIFYLGVQFINILYHFLYCLIVINFILIFPFPNGLIAETANTENYKEYFLSIKNGLIPWMTLGAISGLIVNMKNQSKKNLIHLYFLFGVIILTMLLTKSTTGIIVTIIFFLCLKLLDNKTISKLFTLYKIVPWCFVFYIIFVIGQGLLYFSNTLEKIFNKQGTFTGRIGLWNQSIDFITLKPILGYGIREIEIIQTHYGRGYSSHNFVLYLLLCGGVISLLIFIALVINLSNKSKKYKSNQIQHFLSLGFLAFFVATLTESSIYQPLWFGLFALYASLDIIIWDNRRCFPVIRFRL